MSTADNAKRYSNIKYSLAIIETIYFLLLLLLSQGLGISKFFVQGISTLSTHRYFVLPVYLLGGYLVIYLLNFPLNLYHSFILEHRFSLSNQKIGDWFSDQAKGFIISYCIGIICLSAFYYVLEHYPAGWWLIISCFWVFFSLILARLVPLIIIPLFFKYKKLADEKLRLQIIQLAEAMKVKILDVYEIDFSKKTLKANAAFVGWGKTRRVLLADTLKDKYTLDEISVILAHEFAHYRLKHLLKLLFLSAVATVCSFYLIFKTHLPVLTWFGLSSLSDIASLPVLLIYFMVVGIVSQPLENYISRIFETNADKIAIEVTGLRDAFIATMDKLASQNLSDRDPHPAIKFFFFDHPPIDERIAMAKSLLVNS